MALAEQNVHVDSISLHTRDGLSFEFVFVPPGNYKVGRNLDGLEVAARALTQTASRLDEGPEKQVELRCGFFMARRQIMAYQFADFINRCEEADVTRYIVTNQLSNFAESAGRGIIVKPEADRWPANTVTWEGANAFAKWQADRSGWKIRLPTEDEWEISARGADGVLQPVAPGAKQGLLVRPGSADIAVDANPENMSIFGVFHTLSSVGDWTSDDYLPSRDERKLNVLADGPKANGHVLKRCLNQLCERELGDKVGRNGCYGFRLVLEADERGQPRRLRMTGD